MVISCLKKFIFLVIAMLSMLCMADSLASLNKVNEGKKQGDELSMKGAIQESNKSSGTPIDLPAPIGEDMKGIIIPQYDADGRRVMNFTAEKARKINEEEVEVESLKIGFFERDGKDVTVLVPKGIFHLDTKILTTGSTITIKREDFEMVGDSASFDTIKRLGTMKGHVHTEIRNGLPAESP